MTSKQRAYLKGLAMNIEPIFQIGKSSLTPEYTEAIAEAFNKKELILLDPYMYEGPITMQFLPFGGIQSVYNYHIILTYIS